MKVKKEKKKKIKLRPIEEVLAEIAATFPAANIVGVQGFTFTVKTKRSTMKMEWGSHRMPAVE